MIRRIYLYRQLIKNWKSNRNRQIYCNTFNNRVNLILTTYSRSFSSNTNNPDPPIDSSKTKKKRKPTNTAMPNKTSTFHIMTRGSITSSSRVATATPTTVSSSSSSSSGVGASSTSSSGLAVASTSSGGPTATITSAQASSSTIIPEDIAQTIVRATADSIEIPYYVLHSIDVYLKTKLCTSLEKYEAQPISGRGENSYGSVFQMKLYLQDNREQDNRESKEKIFHCIAKISPKNEARRQTMRVVAYYEREVFVYRDILSEYVKLQLSHANHYERLENLIYIHHLNLPEITDQKRLREIIMIIPPRLYVSSTHPPNEFLVFEDLQNLGFKRYHRAAILDYEHTVLAIRELGKLHAMSFVLREKNYGKFHEAVKNIQVDNLFSKDLGHVSVEFGKKHMRLAIEMLEDEDKLLQYVIAQNQKSKIIETIKSLYVHFKDVCVEFVNGKLDEPHSVICHGDYWNNNILYKYDTRRNPIAAKIIDYQMARYAVPVLDFVQYLFTCTGKELRDRHFDNFKDNYYNQLASTLRNFDLDPYEIYPRIVFENQLQEYGIYGFCMACFALPFFIADASELPNLDESSEAMRQLDVDSETEKEKDRKTSEHLKEYELLNERTRPIFEERMIGILVDLAKYQMLDSKILRDEVKKFECFGNDDDDDNNENVDV